MNFPMPFFGLPIVAGVEIFTLAGFSIICSFVVQIALAYGVFNDAQKQELNQIGPMFTRPWVWGLAVLIGGLPMLAFYWVIHYSTFRR